MILAEEERFASTLKIGEKLLGEYLSKDTDTLSAEDAFKLSDTYGFPFELTKEIVADKGKKVDEKDMRNSWLNKKKELDKLVLLKELSLMVPNSRI